MHTIILLKTDIFLASNTMSEIIIEIRKKGIMEQLSSWPLRNSTAWTSFIIVIGFVLLCCTSFKTKHYGNYSSHCFLTERKEILAKFT